MPRNFSMRLNSSEISTDVVPTSTGRPALTSSADLVDDGVVFLALGLVDQVLTVVALTTGGSWGITTTSSL